MQQAGGGDGARNVAGEMLRLCLRDGGDQGQREEASEEGQVTQAMQEGWESRLGGKGHGSSVLWCEGGSCRFSSGLIGPKTGTLRGF
jgi:hypothetical protein